MEIIAEIGQNHNGDTSLGIELIHAAKENGADIAKFQLFDANRVFSRHNNPWYAYNLKNEITQEQLMIFAKECQKVGIEFMASVFNPDRVKWLEDIPVTRYKIASRSIHDTDLLEAVSATGKPIIASLGMWQNKALPVITSIAPVHFLYCIAKYPAELSDLKLKQVDFKKYFGLSDHTIGITASVVALSRGAKMIEKHFTLDKTLYGPDHACSMTPDELKSLSIFKTEITQCLGNGTSETSDFP